MTDIIVGRALWNGLVRQVAVVACDHDEAVPVDIAAALPLRGTINATIDNRQHSRTLRRVAITHRLEDSTPLRNEVVGARICLTCNLYELKYNLGECGRSSEIAH